MRVYSNFNQKNLFKLFFNKNYPLKLGNLFYWVKCLKTNLFYKQNAQVIIKVTENMMPPIKYFFIIVQKMNFSRFLTLSWSIVFCLPPKKYLLPVTLTLFLRSIFFTPTLFSFLNFYSCQSLHRMVYDYEKTWIKRQHIN